MVEKNLYFLGGEIKTPPFSKAARLEAGRAVRNLQSGLLLSMPRSRPMPSIGKRCHELRIRDEDVSWRIIYRIDTDAILIVEIFQKKTPTTPRDIINLCQARLASYDNAAKD